MAVNFLTWLMDDKAHFFVGWEYDRTFGVTRDGRPKGEGRRPPTDMVVATLHKADELFGADKNLFYGLCQGLPMQPSTEQLGLRGLLAAVSLLKWGREHGPGA